MDLITHLPRVSAGYDSVCTIVVRLSKYVYFVPYYETISAEDFILIIPSYHCC